MHRRKIVFFTGNRAEYGLQYPILKAFSSDERFDYHLLVSGAHLKDEFGKTLSEIKESGFANIHEVAMDMPDDDLLATTYAIGSGVINISRVLANLKPDLLVVYADRFESFAAMIAGTQMRIPTAHIEGGDYTEGGALDDSVRHAMTKLAHIHFATNSQAAERILGMGEEPWRVFNVGYPALDLIKAGNFASPAEVHERFHLEGDRPILVLTQHSVTTEFDEAVDQIKPTLAAIEQACKNWNCQVIITYPNDDAGGRQIVGALQEFMSKKLPSVQLHKNLGRHFYHGLLNVASVCLGNSSSGIKETSAFKLPCIDIGSRQQGRLSGGNVLKVGYDEAAILAAIDKALHNNGFKEVVRTAVDPYGAGNAGKTIADVLADLPLGRKVIQKKMTY